MTAPDDSGDDVSYHAEGEQRDAGWPLVSPWSEFAHAHLEGLRLTGWCSGKLHDGYELHIQALASHADGHIDGIGEDVWIWRDRLTAGHVERHLGQRTFPTDTTTQNPQAAAPATRLNLGRASEPRGRIELVVAVGLDRIVAIPWIAEHAEEVTPYGRDGGTVTLAGVAGLDTDTLTQAAPDAVWQAFCGVQTATPNRWIGHHPALGTVEGQHVDGQLVAPYPGRHQGPVPARGSRSVSRIDELMRLLDETTPAAGDVAAADALAATAESPQPGTPDLGLPVEPPTRSAR